MDRTERKITKIERFAHQFTTGQLGDIGLGPSEHEFIHFVRHHQGTSQAQIAEVLKQDKAAVAQKRPDANTASSLFCTVRYCAITFAQLCDRFAPDGIKKTLYPLRIQGFLVDKLSLGGFMSLWNCFGISQHRRISMYCAHLIFRSRFSVRP